MRKIHCVKCRKAINEGEVAIRHKGWTGFYCSYKCLVLDIRIAESVIVTNELVEEDKKSSHHGWDE